MSGSTRDTLAPTVPAEIAALVERFRDHRNTDITNREIDRLVYDLTEDEIRIVEEATA
jgi:hypothetical protein